MTTYMEWNVPFHIALHFTFDAYAPTMTLTNNTVRNLWTTSSIEVTNLISLKPRYDVLLTFPGTTRNDALKPKPKQQTDTVPFVITYNPALPNICRIIHKHSNVLYSSGRCKNVFTNLPLVVYRRCKNISDILVRAKLPEPTNTDQSGSPSGSFRCNKTTSCTASPFIEDGRNQYTFYSTGQTFKIKSHITCETPNVIYMIQCTKCNLQYIGETKT